MNTKSYVTCAILIVISMLIGSCAAATPVTTSTQAASLPTSPSQPTSVETQVVQQNIVAAVSGDPPGLDPVSTYASGYNIIPAVYSSLLTHEVDETSGMYIYEKVICRLCDSYDIASDDKSITFNLKHGLTFSNGSALTAEDIRWSFERTWNAPGYGKNQLQAGAINDPNQVQVIDDYTLKIDYPTGMNRFSLPDLAVPITAILDKETVSANAPSDDPWASEWVSKNPIGTGPYVMTEWTSGEQIVLEARKDYFGDPKPTISKITLKIIPDEQTQLLLLQSGEIDLAFGLSPQKLNEIPADSNLSIFSVPKAQDILVWRMNPNTPPFDDIHFRTAIAHAIPYEDIINQTMYGFAVKADDICAPGTPAYVPQSIYKYDLDAAKAELALSKYPDGASFTIVIPSDRTEWSDALIWIQSELAKLNIEMTINKLPSAAYQDMAIKREFPNDVNLHVTGPWFNDCMYWAFWVFTSDSSSNYTDLNIPEVDQAVSAALNELDPTKYAALVEQVRQKIVGDVVAIPLYIGNYSVAHKDSLEGFVYWPWPGIEWELLTLK
jgi:peptide/nickel transport system substrate-binding protein